MVTERYTTKNLFPLVWGICLLVSHDLWWGFIITSVWNWFLVHNFGFPVLRLPTAVVICLIMTQLFYRLKDSTSVEKGKLTGARLIESTLNGWLNMVFMQGGPVLLVAWIAHLFM